MTKFTNEHIKQLEKALKHIRKNERVEALKILQDVPFFKLDISWVKGYMIQDMDTKNKGGYRNDTEKYFIDAIQYAKENKEIL